MHIASQFLEMLLADGVLRLDAEQRLVPPRAMRRNLRRWATRYGATAPAEPAVARRPGTAVLPGWRLRQVQDLQHLIHRGVTCAAAGRILQRPPWQIWWMRQALRLPACSANPHREPQTDAYEVAIRTSASWAEAAERAGRPLAFIKRWGREQGLAPDRGLVRRGARRVDLAQHRRDQAITAAVQAGSTTVALARRHRVTHQRISQILERAGVARPQECREERAHRLLADIAALLPDAAGPQEVIERLHGRATPSHILSCIHRIDPRWIAQRRARDLRAAAEQRARTVAAVRQARRRLGLTLQEVARRAGVSYHQVTTLNQRGTWGPRPERLAALLGLSALLPVAVATRRIAAPIRRQLPRTARAS